MQDTFSFLRRFTKRHPGSPVASLCTFGQSLLCLTGRARKEGALDSYSWDSQGILPEEISPITKNPRSYWKVLQLNLSLEQQKSKAHANPVVLIYLE